MCDCAKCALGIAQDFHPGHHKHRVSKYSKVKLLLCKAWMGPGTGYIPCLPFLLVYDSLW